jgi:hypothetical protein
MKYLMPRIQDVLFMTIFLSALLQGPSMLNTDGDLGRHITVGKYILETGQIPTRDIFSNTMTGERLVPHEWLAQLTFAVINRLAGLGGIVILATLLIAVTFTLVYRTMIKRDISRIIAFLIVLLAAFASSLHWLTRPHVFTFLFTAIWVTLLENKTTRPWLFPLTMLLWANTHGAFIVGFAIWGAYLAGWLWDFSRKENTRSNGIRLAVIGASSFAATFINPAGWRLWDTSVGYFGSHFLVDKTIEYQSPNFHIAGTWPFLIMLILYFLLYGFGGKLKMREALLVTGWGALSLYNARNIPIFAIVTSPFLAQLIYDATKKVPTLIRLEQNLANIEKNLRGYLFNMIAIITILFTTQPNPADRFDPHVFPVDASQWLIEHPQEGNMYNFFTWGGYILYRLWPQQRVFIDGQTDFYGEALSREYVLVESVQPGWNDILAKYDVDWVIIQPNQPLAAALSGENWNILYQDSTAIILRKP